MTDAFVDANVDLLDEALGILGDTGPEYEAFGGMISLANHGPMVVEALSELGRADALVEWAERYRPRLGDRPAPSERITAEDWRTAIGDMSRVRDWADFFDAELATTNWTDVVNQWFPRLAPGMCAGVHGAVRTAHAARSLGKADTPMRRRELAEGLGYWAGQYHALAESRGAMRGMLPSEALPRVEQLEVEARTGWIRFTDPIDTLTTKPAFVGVPDLVDADGDPDVVVHDLARVFARLLIANNPSVNPRALCHGLTAGTATRMMLPYLTDEARRASLRYGWQTAAAFYGALVLEPAAADIDDPLETVDEIVDEALACPDEHGIKVTEACLREHALDGDPVFLAAALSTTRRLNDVGLNLY